MSVYRDLYYRWEREQWEAGAIDLDRDRNAWMILSADARGEVVRDVATFHIVAMKLGETLTPLADGVYSEEEAVFLTTHLVDAARQLVFTQRVLEEVWQGDMAEALVLDIEPDIGFLFETSSEIAARIVPRVGNDADDDDPDTFAPVIEGVRLHHVRLQDVLEGRLQRLEAAAQQLPGLLEGLAAIKRDMERHRAFGRAFLDEYAPRDGAST